MDCVCEWLDPQVLDICLADAPMKNNAKDAMKARLFIHILNNIQNKNNNELTPKNVHPSTNMNHIHLDYNLQQPELRHIPTIEINQSNNTCTNMESIESIYDNTYSPTSIQNP
jgi:hypothetical protein